SYPGADEVGAVLTAAALARRLDRRPRLAVLVPGDPEAGSRVAPYENVPVSETVHRQVVAAGAVPVDDPGEADATVLVHPPADPTTDGGAPGVGGEARVGGATGVADPSGAVLDALAELPSTAILGLADVRHPNGAD